MGMAGVGTGVGAAVKGYYGAKKARNASETKDAEMRIQELEDQLREAEQANEMAKIPEQAARDRQTAAVEAAKRQGELTDAGYEQNRAIRTEAASVRGEDTAAAGHSGDMETAKNKLPQAKRTEAGAVRTERVAIKEQPGKEITADDSVNDAHRGIRTKERADVRGGEVASQETQQYDDRNAYNTLGTAIGALKESGNTAAVDDWYRESMPNGHEITTTDDPEVEGGYIMTDNTGKVKKVGSMDELVTNLETVREQIEDRIRAPGKLGVRPGQGRVDESRRGISGGGSRGGTQLERMYPQVVKDLAQQYPEMEEWELRLTAIKFLKERGGEPDDVFRRKWSADTMEVILGMSDIGGKKEKAWKEFWEMSKLLFGEEGGKPGADDGELTDDEQADAIFDGS